MEGGCKVPIAFHLDMHLDQLTSWVEKWPQAAVAVDEQGMVEAVSRKFLDLLRCRLDQVVGQPLERHLNLPREELAHLRHPDAQKGLFRLVQGELLLSGSAPVSVTIQMITGKGPEGWHHLLLVFPAEGSTLFQRRAEQIVHSLPQGLLLLGADLRVAEINPAACRMFGMEDGDIRGQRVNRLFSRLEEGEGVGELRERITRGESFRGVSATWILEGEPRVVTVDYEKKAEWGGGGFLTITDKTRTHLLDMKVRQTDRLAMIGQIAAGTAHEIRNPLTSIRGFLQVIRHTLDERGDLKGQGYTEIMLREIDRINHLLGEFLLMGKPRAVKRRRVKVDRSIRELLPLLENEALLHNTEVRYFPGMEECPLVWVDPELLKQVVLNLCKNGIEAMGEGGALILRLVQTRNQEHLILEVEDRGPGIPSDVIERIFDPFYTTKENGTGLGLAVSKQIIDDVGGEIQVSSGEMGTVFRVYLPCVRD